MSVRGRLSEKWDRVISAVSFQTVWGRRTESVLFIGMIRGDDTYNSRQNTFEMSAFERV